MRLLLDTSTLLWWLGDDQRLGRVTRSAITDGRNDVYVSSVSIVEIAVKTSIGKLTAPDDLVGALAEEGFDELPLLSTHAAMLANLPLHHRDPFDRLLIAQATVEQLMLATPDSQFAPYGVPLLTD